MRASKRPIASAMFAVGIAASASYAQDSGYSEFSPEPVADFHQAITRAVVGSPRVNAEWYNLQATREAERGARGGYLPSVDLTSEWGREQREAPLIDFDGESYSRDATRLSVTQMLFDGFATRDEVRRLGYLKLSRYFQFRRASEEIALEAAEAYIETMKFQKLVEFAEDNLEVHKAVYDKIEERAGGGVSQGVDLDQARARVALAESNLLTERTNLYDVNRQFQRVIGSLPAEELSLPRVSTALIPDTSAKALNLAYQRSPVINVAIENLRSSQEGLNATNAPMMPRFDLRYRNELEHDTDGFEGRYEEEAVEVVITYNLFRGGTDRARKREFYNLYNAAIEERKQACLNVRQEVTIAYNDVVALERQVDILARNMESQDKTRRAYRDQFDLGQRTLLDLLDSQNEFFDTQRSASNARADLAQARARILAEMGMLLAALDVEGLNAEEIAELDLNLTRDPDDENSQHRCPPIYTPQSRVAQSELTANLGSADDDSGVDPAAAAAVAGLAAGNGRYQQVDKHVVEIELKVQFEFDSAVIARFYDEEIANVATVLRDNPTVHATVEGHADSTGPAEYNQWLSERRAEAVRQVLVDVHSVNPGQLVAVGFGQDQPVADNATSEGRERNRRVELVVDANGKK